MISRQRRLSVMIVASMATAGTFTNAKRQIEIIMSTNADHGE